MKSEPKYLACEESPIRVLSTFELFSVLPSLYWLLWWADFFAFIATESPAVGCVQHSFMHLALQIRTSRRASRTALPVLRSRETSSQRRRVMHVSGISDGRECKLTFLGRPQIDIPKRDRHVRTHVHCENRSLTQSSALLRWVERAQGGAFARDKTTPARLCAKMQGGFMREGVFVGHYGMRIFI